MGFPVKAIALCLAALAATFSFSASAKADTVTLQPGPDTSKDIWTTSVYSYAPCCSYGPGGGLANDLLRVGGWGDLYYSLLQFDLTGLPSVASSVTLRLYNTESYSGIPYLGTVEAPTGIYLNRITTSWDIATQPITPLSPDNERLWWANLPSFTQVSGVLAAPNPTAYYTIDITDLYNGWQNGAYANDGLLLTPASNWFNFDSFASSRNATAAYRPELIIASIPEPENYAMIAAGLAFIGFQARCRKTKRATRVRHNGEMNPA